MRHSATCRRLSTYEAAAKPDSSAEKTGLIRTTTRRPSKKTITETSNKAIEALAEAPLVVTRKEEEPSDRQARGLAPRAIDPQAAEDRESTESILFNPTEAKQIADVKPIEQSVAEAPLVVTREEEEPSDRQAKRARTESDPTIRTRTTNA